MVSNPERLATAFDGSRDATVFGLGALFAGLAAVSVWASAVAHAVQFLSQTGGLPEPLLLVSGATSLVGLALGSLAYARYRGVDLSLGLPRRDALLTGFGAVVAPAALLLATAAASNAGFGVPLSELTNRYVNPDASAWTLARLMGLPAVFLGLGYGFLFCGLVYERVRELVAPGDAVVVGALLVGFFWLLPIEPTGVSLAVGSLVEFALSLFFGVAFGMAVGIVYLQAETAAGVRGLAWRHLLVLALAVVGVFGAATGLTSPGEVVTNVLWLAALGIGLLGYERTRSVWVPALALVLFNLTLAGVVYVEAALGVSPV